MGHLNTNSLAAKFDKLKLLIGESIDILIIAKTQIVPSFPNTQFIIEEFLMSFKLSRNSFGCGVLIYVQEHIPSKQLTIHKLPDDMEGIFVEINLRNVNWQLFGTYHPPRQRVEYFLKHVSHSRYL